MDSNWVVELSSKLVQEMLDLGQHQLEDMQANHQTKMEQIEAARWCSCHSGVQAGQAGDTLEDHLKEIEMKDTNVRRV